MKFVFILMVTSVFLAFASNQIEEEGEGRKFQQFEVDWLTANMNNDREWLAKFSFGKLEFVPTSKGPIDQRAKLTTDLLTPTMPDDAKKIRITGTIQLITNDSALNRSFSFLDTFNRRGGKWEVIASNFTPSADTEVSTWRETAAGSLSDAETEKEIRKLDLEAAKAIREKDEKAIARFFTANSVTNDPRNGLTKGSAGVIEAARSNLINYYSFERNIESVQIFDSTAVTMGNEVVTLRSASGGPGNVIRRRYTNVWMKRGGSWVIVARHANVICG